MLPTSLQSGDRAPTRMKLLHIDGPREEGCSMNIYDYDSQRWTSKVNDRSDWLGVTMSGECFTVWLWFQKTPCSSWWPYQHWCPLVRTGRWYLASWVLGGQSHLGAIMRRAPAWCHCPCPGWSGWHGCAFLPAPSPSPSLHPLPLQRLNSGLLCSFLSTLPLWLNSDWFTSSGSLLGSPSVQGPGRPGFQGSCVCACVCVCVWWWWWLGDCLQTEKGKSPWTNQNLKALNDGHREENNNHHGGEEAGAKGRQAPRTRGVWDGASDLPGKKEILSGWLPWLCVSYNSTTKIQEHEKRKLRKMCPVIQI